MSKFINPYNFIPMGKKKSMAAKEDEGLLSGVIEYSVLTKTPVFIPNTSNYYIFSKNPDEDMNKDVKEIHKTYDFFSYNNLEGKVHGEKDYYEPVIPGSEIRGMFRSNFEILTNSCMSALDSDMQLSKRTMESYKAGLLYRRKNGDENFVYDLYDSVDVLWRTFGKNNTKADLDKWDNKNNRNKYERECYLQENFAEGERVSFTLNKREGRGVKPLASDVKKFKESNKGEVGYIIKGEKSPDGPSKKHCCHIFMKKQDSNALEENVKISLLDDLLKVYKENVLENASHYDEYIKKFEEYKDGKGNDFFPVYYCIIKDDNNRLRKKLFLAPACKTREIYDSSLRKLAKELAPCTSKSGFCETCELFGTVTDDESKSSKIRFSDLEVEKENENKSYYVEKPVTLPEMSSPKLNNMEFYLERPGNAYFWTYDYYISPDGKLHIEQGKLAGRKFYWHQNIDDNYNPDKERTKRNITIRPVRSKVTFHGKLFFDGISKGTLNKLIYLINAGDENDIENKEHGYKIGTAKPLGLGSIACSVEKVLIKSYKIEAGKVEQKITPYDEYSVLEVKSRLDKDIIKNYDKMTGFNTIQLEHGEIFSYPIIEDDSNGYAWFVENHKGVNKYDRETIINMPNTRNEMIFKEYLHAMEPRVKRVNRIRNSEVNGNNYRGQNNRNPNNRNQQRNATNTSNVEVAKVLAYKSTSSIRFSIAGSAAKTISCSREGINPNEVQKLYPEGSEIKVRFIRKDSNTGFESYKIVK